MFPQLRATLQQEGIKVKLLVKLALRDHCTLFGDDIWLHILQVSHCRRLPPWETRILSARLECGFSLVPILLSEYESFEPFSSRVDQSFCWQEAIMLPID